MQLVALCYSNDAAAAAKLFVQLDGVTLVADDVDDAAANRTAIAALAISLPAYAGDHTARAAVLAAMRSDWSRYAIEIVDVRPDDDDWSMAVVSSAAPLGDGVAGAAVLDCDDDRGTGDVVFAFAGPDTDALALAATVSQELAHAYGLEHVDDPRDLLYPLATDGDAEFRDECVALVEGGRCDDVHRRYCDDGKQNAHAELLHHLGPAVPDQDPPEVALVSPGDGDRMIAGSDLQVVVEASDDTRVERVVLLEGDRELGEDRSPPWEFVVTAVPAGSYAIRARAIDVAGHERESEIVMITADAVAPAGDFARGDESEAGCRMGVGSVPGATLALVLLVFMPARSGPRSPAHRPSRRRRPRVFRRP